MWPRSRGNPASDGSRGSALPLAGVMALGVLAGIGGFTFGYGDGTAYLSQDPRACANCHVMHDHYDSWQNSSHRHVAVCNDCHLPPGFFSKWLTKADNGFLHSLAFTMGGFPDPIRIKPRNSRRTQRACLDCHGELLAALAPIREADDQPACVSCHADVGHAHR